MIISGIFGLIIYYLLIIILLRLLMFPLGVGGVGGSRVFQSCHDLILLV